MGFLANASALFVGLRVSDSYHQALQVDAAKVQALKAARKEIRTAIREAASSIQLRDAYWEPAFAARPSRLRPEIVPRFFTQGSVAYDLLVDPVQTPPQQIDLDDGMYVRVDFLDGKPALVAKALFGMVEAALAPLCRARGWKLNPPPIKNTCVRVQLASDSHVDIPIYSAPRDVEGQLVFASDALQKAMVTNRAGKEIKKLPADKIMLANRDGTWQQSDPLQLHEWVDGCVMRYGEDFRRVCRYLKGWRDYAWEGCCLSSITIMAAVAEALKDMQGAHRNLRDDTIMFEVAQRLPAIFRADLFNPIFPDQRIVLNDWAHEDRADVVESAEALAKAMHDALKGTGVADLVVAALRRAFGNRIPNRPDVVEIAPRVPATAAAILAEQPAKVAAPRIVKSTSG
jgi:hypothetical protein